MTSKDRNAGNENAGLFDDEAPDTDRGDGLGEATLSRRHLLAAGVGLGAASCMPDSEQTSGLHPAVEQIRANREVIGRVGESGQLTGRASIAPSYFPQPGEMTINEVAGEKNLKLDVSYLDLDFVKRDGAIVRGRVRAYNRHVPGPTIRCDPGDRLNIELTNSLPADESFAFDYEGCTTDAASGNLGPAEAGLPHAFNTTNLHTHGLHVSPKSLCGETECGAPPYSERPTLASDDVFVDVAPGESQNYCIVLPDFHAPGTHWYHAHKHGSTGIQVNNGLVGALIVREQGDDRILGNQVHEDQIFLMQEIMETDDGNDQLVYAQAQGDSSKFFINGAYQPLMRMQTGEIQRWRFINATSRPRGLCKLRLVRLQDDEPLLDTSDIELAPERGGGLGTDLPQGLAAVETVQPELFQRIRDFQRIAELNARPMHLIAVDGISLYGKPPREVTGWDVAPGNRADFLVKISDPGEYAVVKDLHPLSGGRSPEVQILAYIEVTPGSTDMALPALIPGRRPCYLDPIERVDAEKTVDFQAVSAGQWEAMCPDVPVPWTCDGQQVICDGTSRDCEPEGMPPLLSRIFAMDCARFDGDVVEEKYTMELNTAEEWTLRNFAGGAHPFHIHVNPFQVVEIFDPSQGDNGTTTTFGPDEALWQDVVAIPLPKNGTPGHVRIRQRFLTYPGDFVIHCHFLNHEDLGMMKRVRVVPGPDAPGHPPCVPVRVCSRS